MKRTWIAIAAVVCVIAMSMTSASAGKMRKMTSTNMRLQQDVHALARSNTAFALAMYWQLTAKAKGNIFFSPASIQTALAMTYAGARGETAKQMAEVLRFPSETPGVHLPSRGGGPAPWKKVSKPWPAARLHRTFGELIRRINTPKLDYKKKPVYQLSIANELWGAKDYSFRSEFIALVKKDYGAGLNNVDFGKPAAARKTINDWVEKQTRDKIKNLIPAGMLDKLTRLVLTNAVYFKSGWAYTFSKHATKDGAFHVSADESVTVPLMHQQKSFQYAGSDDLQVIELPYMYNDLSMIVLLPRKIDGLAALEQSLTPKKLDKYLAALKRETVKLTLPKFKFTSQFALAGPLKAMGMVDAFSDKADFSGMTTAEKLCIGAVIHKTFVAVDEKGTEAAAATAVMMMKMSMPPRPRRPKIFKADRPFLFFIRHNATGEILFMGRVVNPQK